MIRRKKLKKSDKWVSWHSVRYNKTIRIPPGFIYNGANWVVDCEKDDGLHHDWDFFYAMWEDGTPMSFEEANNNYRDWLKENGHWFKSWVRYKALNLFGGKAWSEHRHREMVFHNMKLIEQLMVCKAIDKQT